MTGRHRTHPSRWEILAWITLEAIAITLAWIGIVAVVYAASLVAGVWQ